MQKMVIKYQILQKITLVAAGVRSSGKKWMKEVNKVQTELEEEAKRRKVNWNALLAEFTWEKLWTTRTWGNIFGHFSKVLFLSLTPTFFDMATDALNGLNFVYGTDYQKRVKNLSDPLNENCTHVGTYLTYKSDGRLE